MCTWYVSGSWSKLLTWTHTVSSSMLKPSEELWRDNHDSYDIDPPSLLLRTSVVLLWPGANLLVHCNWSWVSCTSELCFTEIASRVNGWSCLCRISSYGVWSASIPSSFYFSFVFHPLFLDPYAFISSLVIATLLKIHGSRLAKLANICIYRTLPSHRLYDRAL